MDLQQVDSDQSRPRTVLGSFTGAMTDFDQLAQRLNVELASLLPAEADISPKRRTSRFDPVLTLASGLDSLEEWSRSSP